MEPINAGSGNLDDDMLAKYQAQGTVAADHMGLGQEIAHGAVATVADFGSSVWNSITPEKYNTSTADLLSRIDSDALQVYNEHTDLIHAASFVGGVFVPAGLAFKGMTALRMGVKGASWFSKAGEEMQLAKVAESFAASKNGASAALDATKGSLYGAMVANALVDNVAAEAAIVMTMNAHPYMEDYMKDLPSNFLLGASIGGAIGVGVGAIGTRAAIRGVQEPIAKEANKVITEGMGNSDVSLTRNMGDQIKLRAANVEGWKGTLAKANDANDPLTLNSLTKSLLQHVITSNEGRILKDFDSMASGELATMPVELKEPLIKLIQGDDRLISADSISYLGSGSIAGKDKKGIIDGAISFFVKKVGADGVEKEVSKPAVYLPKYGDNGVFVAKSEAGDYTSAADMGYTYDKLPAVNAAEYASPRPHAYLDRQIMTTAEIELDEIQAWRYVKDMNIGTLNSRVIHPEDMSMMRAIQSRYAQLQTEAAAEGKELPELSVLMTREAPSYEKLQSAMEKVAIRGAGFHPEYPSMLAKLDKTREEFTGVLSGGGISKNFKRVDTSISQESAAVIKDWLYGGGKQLRKLLLADESRIGHGNFSGRNSSVIANLRASSSTQNLLNKLAPMQDHEGYVLLYRGMGNAPSGHNLVESYSLNPVKARHFAAGNPEGLRMYKVHVDDILASVEDYGMHGGSNSEILVMNKSTRPNAIIPLHAPDTMPSKFTSIDKIGNEALQIPTEVPKAAPPSGRSSWLQMNTELSNVEGRMADDLTAQGLMKESVLKRVGVKDATDIGEGLSKFSTEADIQMALHPSNRALLVGSSVDKVPFAELRSQLNGKLADDMNATITEAVLSTSPDKFTRGLGELMATADMRINIKYLMEGIDEVTQVGTRSTMFRSANSVVENFGAVGTIATQLGKDVTRYVNKAKEALVVPISERMAPVLKDPALVVEANMAITVNAAIKGKRIYQGGQFHVPVEGMKDAAGNQIWEVAKDLSGKEFTINSQKVRDLFDAFDTAGKSMYHLNNSYHKVLGKPAVTDLGFWIPAFNPRNKEIAYVLDANGATSILWARTTGELSDKIRDFEISARNSGRNTTVITKDSNLKAFNDLHGRETLENSQLADINMQHTGASANAVIATNTELMGEIINSYDHYISRGVTNLVDVQLSPVMQRLQMLGDFSESLHNPGSHGIISKLKNAPVNPGNVLRNIMLGKGVLADAHPSWAEWQQRTQVFTDLALEKVSKIASPLLEKLGTVSPRNEETWTKLNKDLEAAGYTPFRHIDDFQRYLNEGKAVNESLTPRTVALFNSMAATSLLRFMEIAQPFVNMVSLPILMSGATRRQFGQEFMGAKLVGNPQFNTAATMHDAVRWMNNDAAKPLMKIAEDMNLFKPIVSEANAAMAHSRSLDKGIHATAEKLMESSFVKIMSTPADYSETLSRRLVFSTGVVMAKKAYPGLSDHGVMTYARSFMDEALGNYASSQRPAAFQGTIGVSVGIFQTYMLTLAQQLYRGIERKDWVGLSKQMFAQSAVFGGSSLPGFHIVSEQIGSNFSDNHVDLETGLFRAVGDEAATNILYGLPASLGLGITTRGDIQPRIANPIQGIDSLVAVNLTKSAFASGKSLVEAATSADGNTGQAMMEALSAQSISRPIARISELFSGRSVTAAGNTVATNTTGNPYSEQFVLHGLVARLMSTRPIEEVKAREAMHLDSVYKGVEGDARKALVKRLRTHIANGNLDAETVQQLQFEYLRTGSPSGWRSAVNDAMRQKVMGGDFSVKSKLHPDAPYQQMVDDLG